MQVTPCCKRVHSGDILRQILDVQNNSLNDFPSELGRVESLQKILASGNFLRKVNKTALNQVLALLRSVAGG